MSQVRNLRAMFEQKGDSSPPDRGRSPGLPPQVLASSESPRPLSKVRTSFIAIEKDGRIGLQRDPSTESIPSLQRFPSASEHSVGTPPPVPDKDRTTFLSDRSERGSRAGVGVGMAAIPQSPEQEKGGRPTATQSGLPAGKDKGEEGSNHDKEPSRRQQSAGTVNPPSNRQENEGVKLQGPREKTLGATQGQANGTPSTGLSQGRNGTASLPAVASVKTPSKEAPKSAASQAIPNISTSRTKVKAPAKSPALPKTPTSTVKPLAMSSTPNLSTPKPSTPKPQSKSPERKAAEPVKKSATPQPSTNARKAKAPSAVKVPPPELDRGIGFVKPKPKSPTKPVQLPAGLTTHTASSATKTRQSLSRQSGSYQAMHAAPSPSTKKPRQPSDGASLERGIGFIKPRPKSPTRPVQLPAGLTTHTASSATKTRQSLSSAQSGNYQAMHAQRRTSTSPKAAAAGGDSLERGIGFVKPRPKSPTRPVQLPAGLTTHTASSATKVHATARPSLSLSRQSGSYAALHSSAAARAPSRQGAAGSLRRSNSTLGTGAGRRQSFGPPPPASRQASRDRVAQKEREMDEGFLDRMMRPTLSSQSKTADRLEAVGGAGSRRSSVVPGAGERRPASRQQSVPRRVVEEEAPLSTVPKIVGRGGAGVGSEAGAGRAGEPVGEEVGALAEVVKGEGEVELASGAAEPGAAEEGHPTEMPNMNGHHKEGGGAEHAEKLNGNAEAGSSPKEVSTAEAEEQDTY